MHGFKEFMMAQEAFAGGAPNVAPGAQTRQNLNTMRGELQQGMQQPPQGFWAGLRQGSQAGWNRGQGQFTQGIVDDSQIMQYADAAKAAFQQASATYKKIEDKVKALGVDPKLAILLLATMSTAGGAAIPYAVLKYYAGKSVSDYAKEKLNGPKEQQNQPQQQQQPTNEIFTPQSRGKLGYAMGYGAGFLGGETKTIAGKVGNYLKGKANDIIQFAKDNKVALAKAALLAAIGVATGAGVNIAAGALNDAGAIDAIGNAVVNSGLASQEQVAPILSNMQQHIPTLDSAVSSFANPEKLLTGGSTSMASNVATDPLIKLGINTASAFK
jgi:hypothetical protein